MDNHYKKHQKQNRRNNNNANQRSHRRVQTAQTPSNSAHNNLIHKDDDIDDHNEIDTEENSDMEQNDAENGAPVSTAFKTLSLMCTFKDCKESCKNKKLLHEHLLVKHKQERFRCLVKDCAESFSSRFVYFVFPK